jgi:hypothetical protein
MDKSNVCMDVQGGRCVRFKVAVVWPFKVAVV